jgi:CheY-like chemotaxis protein
MRNTVFEALLNTGQQTVMRSDEMPYRLLVIEDNGTDVLMLRHALAQHGIQHEMLVIEDGEEAIEYLASCNVTNKPDLIVIDLNLPKQDGLDVLRKYRFSALLVGTPMIVLTSSSDPGDRNRAEMLGIDAYIRKPIQLDDFLAIGETIRKLLTSRTRLESDA